MTLAVGGKTPGWERQAILDLDECRFLTTALAADDEKGVVLELILGPDRQPLRDTNGQLMKVVVRRPNIMIMTCPDGWPTRQDALPQPRRREP